MNWLKRRLRKWLEVPIQPYELSPEDLTKIVMALTESELGRGYLKGFVYQVLGVKREVNTITNRYGDRVAETKLKMDPLAGTFLQDTLKALFDGWTGHDMDKIKSEARSEAREAAKTTVYSLTDEHFLDSVVARINKKRILP